MMQRFRDWWGKTFCTHDNTTSTQGEWDRDERGLYRFAEKRCDDCDAVVSVYIEYADERHHDDD